MTTFERQLKKKGYSASIINDLVFEKSKRKKLKKQGKGNKPKASVALTSEELKILYEKGLLGMCSPEALLKQLWLFLQAFIDYFLRSWSPHFCNLSTKKLHEKNLSTMVYYEPEPAIS